MLFSFFCDIAILQKENQENSPNFSLAGIPIINS